MRYTLSILLITCAFTIDTFAQSTIGHKSPEFYFRNGLELLDKANFTSARSSFQTFIELAPEDARSIDAQYYIAYSSLNLYNLDAEQLFLDFLSKYNSHPKALTAYYDLGGFFYRDKNYKKASQYLSKVNFQSLTATEQVEARFKLGYSLFSQRKFSDALTHFNMLKIKTNKYNHASSYYAAYIEYQNEEYDLALADLAKAEQGDSYKVLVPYFIANIYYKQNRFEDLVLYGEQVLSENRKLSAINDIYLLTAEGFYQLSNFEQALIYYDKYKVGLKSGRPNPEVFFRMARSSFETGNDEAAINNFKAIASRKDNHGAAASYYLGWLYLRGGNLEFAASAFKIASNSKDDEEIAEKAYFQYSKTSVDLGRSTEAIKYLIQFKELYPQSEDLAEADELLSLAYLNSNNLDLAIEHMETLGNMTSQTKKAYQKATLMKGNQFYNQRKYRSAVGMYEKSLQNPLDPILTTEARFWLAESYAVGRLYEEAIPEYQAVIGGRSEEFTLKARYGLGYSYYNIKDYSKALIQFRQFTNEYSDSKRDRVYQDAIIRLADCYFVAKNYPRSIELYNQSIKSGNTEKGYTYLQIGLVHSFNGDKDEAKANFRKLIRQFTDSPYMDDALYEYASIDYESGNYGTAITSFTDLIEKKPNSPFVPYALQRRATAHYNLQTYGRTQEDYVTFLKLFPTHKEANNVLLALQEVLSIQSKSDDFEEYLAEYKEANPDSEGLEVVEFETAKNYYNALSYDKAIEAFSSFIQAYPSDFKVHEAKFYIAESYFRKNENNNALPLYYEVLAEDQVSQVTRVIQRIADLEYVERNYVKSLNYYKLLESSALNNRQLFNSWIGQMRVFYQVSRYDSVAAYADKILEEGPMNAGMWNVATLYKGKDAYVRGNYDGAIGFFQATIDNAKDISAAEALFLIGEVKHQQTLYRESNEVLFTMPTDFSVYEEWLGKAFLLIADNYMALNETLQARATLNSIIENTTSGIIANQAKAKLSTLDELEEQEIQQVDTTQVDSLQIDNEGNSENNGNEK